MRQWIARTVAVLAVAAAFAAPAAHADPPAPSGSGHPVWSYIVDFLPFTYWDNDSKALGPGKLIILHVGNDPNNKAILIKVQLTQGGKTYVGSGIAYENKFIFSVANYFFQCDTPGWGSYHIAGKPDKLYWVYLETGLP